MPAAPTTVSELSQIIVRSRLLASDEVKAATRQVAPTGKDADDLEAFRRLLVSKGHLTEYQAALLLRGHSDGFFLGPYRILEQIARGRFAGVYRAAHASGKVVSIKVLPSSRARDPEVLARFQREAKLLTKLEHPNVIRAIEVGEADGRHYLVTEYLDGDTLEEVLEKRTVLPPAEAVRVIYQALLGLQHIHDKGLIHRDLKPVNLILVDGNRKGDDTSGQIVKILEIGLGKSVFDEGDSQEAMTLTGDGSIVGTPEYIAPEQARSTKLADIRSDIYSLGCVLYRALTGRPPFVDKNVVALMTKHATAAPKPLADFLRQVPDGLQIVMNWMLAKDPAQRYPTPERASQALQLFLKNAPPAAPSPPPPAPLPEYLKGMVGSAAPPVGKLEPAKKPTAVPRAEPVAEPVPRAEAVEPVIDVELVSVQIPDPAADRRGLFDLNRRDAIMLLAGSGAVAVAAVAGFGLARIVRRTPEDSDAPKDGDRPSGG